MNKTEEKLSFWDSICGFALKLFGIVLLADFLAQIFMFVFGSIVPLLGDFLTDFLIAGMGILIYITSVYQVAWKKGFRDLGLVSRSVTVYSPIKGLLAGLIACIPGAISYVFLLTTTGTAKTIAKYVFAVLHSYGYLLIDLLYKQGSVGLWLTALFLIPLPVIAFLGYPMGYKNILVTKVLMYGKNGLSEK